ncbi:unnamed protein product [marine sediment metagenome]|uniref:Uncharacterized protein n=1 Tax=marine sediment metagenome TaxID=412755 RepID=X1C705_9ZZZZ
MNEFKNGKNLYEEQKRQGKIREYEHPIPEAGKPTHHNLKRPPSSSQTVCEHHGIGGCKASLEAYELGLAKTVFPCEGLIPPVCSVRLKLAAGKTVKELYGK